MYILPFLFINKRNHETMKREREISQNTQIQNSFSHFTQKNLVFQEYHVRSQHSVAMKNSLKSKKTHQQLAIGQAQSRGPVARLRSIKP